MAKTTLPIQFPPVSNTTEQGDGVVIYWTGQRTDHAHPFRWVCASVEGNRPPKKRMFKWETPEGIAHIHFGNDTFKSKP